MRMLSPPRILQAMVILVAMLGALLLGVAGTAIRGMPVEAAAVLGTDTFQAQTIDDLGTTSGLQPADLTEQPLTTANIDDGSGAGGVSSTELVAIAASTTTFTGSIEGTASILDGASGPYALDSPAEGLTIGSVDNRTGTISNGLATTGPGAGDDIQRQTRPDGTTGGEPTLMAILLPAIVVGSLGIVAFGILRRRGSSWTMGADGGNGSGRPTMTGGGPGLGI